MKWCWSVGAVVLFGWGCTMGEGSDGPPGLDASASDGGIGFVDGGAGADGAFPPPGREGIPADPESGFTAGSEYDSARDDAFSCFDGVDNDAADDGIDCEDSDCRDLRSCCVGAGDCCGDLAEPPLPPLVDATGCADGSLAVDCLASGGITARAFGEPLPWVREGNFYPGGNETFDSGLIVGDPADLTNTRVDITALFTHAEGCGISCLEGAAVGLTTQEIGSDGVDMRPLAALLYSGSRGDFSLVVGGEITGRWAALEDEASEEWTLIARPTGELTVERTAEPAVGASFFYRPSRGASLALYGRNRNETPLPNAGIGGLVVESRLCDIPSSWADRVPLALVDDTGSAYTPPSIGSPSLTLLPAGDRVFAFTEPATGGSRVRLASQPAGADDGRFELLGNPDSALSPGRLHDAAGIDDPELVWDDDAGMLRVYYTGTDADGARSIGLAFIDAATGAVMSVADRPILDPATFAVEGFDDPTVMRHPLAWILIARAHLGAGRTELEIFVSMDGVLWEPFTGTTLADVLDPLQSGDRWPGFDADEVAAPSLLVHNGAYQLHFARRKGTRWSLGVVISDDLLYWRHLREGESVLEGAQSFDRLGVAEPDVIAEGTTVRMVYAALDGVRSWPAQITREATTRGSW